MHANDAALRPFRSPFDVADADFFERRRKRQAGQVQGRAAAQLEEERLRPRPIFLASRDRALAYFGATIG
jgi:hypothetical protein